MDPITVAIVLICTGIKVLLIPSYRSTDFEVHRNWLAITYSKPVSQWYSDDASPSPWTLDYPPFFAWFEWGLAQIAQYVDPAMLDVNNLDYASPQTILFQRLTVIITDLSLVYTCHRVMRTLPQNRRRLGFFLVCACPALIIVDHIHFQYNGILLALFILSTWSIATGREVVGAFLFTFLLCMKHIFLYAAPIYFVFLYRHYCRGHRKLPHFIALSSVVLSVFAVAFGPFILNGSIMQVVHRLFPVRRGLLHAYWAPNFWALYAFTDKALQTLLPKLNLSSFISPTSTATLTGGLIGDATFAVLPQITPATTVICTLCAMAPCLVLFWIRPIQNRYPHAVVYCTMCSFLFGYHVHEKAILMVLVPLALLAAQGTYTRSVKEFAFLTPLATYSLFPLLIHREEHPIKVLLLAVYVVIAYPWLHNANYWTILFSRKNSKNGRKMHASSDFIHNRLTKAHERLYMWGIMMVEFYNSVVHIMIFGQEQMQFLPLLLTSVYCSIGVVYCWGMMLRYYCKQLYVVLHNSYERADSKVRWVSDVGFDEDDDEEDDDDEDDEVLNSALAKKYKSTTRRLNVDVDRKDI